MNPPPPAPTSLPALDATCDRIVAALTRRLSEAARHIQSTCPPSGHDFLVPVMRPDLTEDASCAALSRLSHE